MRHLIGIGTPRGGCRGRAGAGVWPCRALGHSYGRLHFGSWILAELLKQLAVDGTGFLLAALLLGVADVAGKYYIPKLGGFIVYSLMIAILLWRPQGLFSRERGR